MLGTILIIVLFLIVLGAFLPPPAGNYPVNAATGTPASPASPLWPYGYGYGHYGWGLPGILLVVLIVLLLLGHL